MSATETIARNYSVLRLSDVVESPDVTGGPLIYANRIIQLSSEASLEDMRASFASIERSFGQRHCQLVPLDIDIVVCDGNVLRSIDITRPYYITALRSLR